MDDIRNDPPFIKFYILWLVISITTKVNDIIEDILLYLYSQVLEVRHVACLPCLENLKLQYNPVTIVVDYRTKILELFGDRASEVGFQRFFSI